MFAGPSQYLEVYLPSPTTVSFTVTTRRPESSKFRANVQIFLRHTCRIFLAYSALLANAVKGRDVVVDGDARFLDVFLKLSLGSSLVKPLTERIEWWILALLSLLVVYLCLRRDYVGKLLVLPCLCISIEMKYQTQSNSYDCCHSNRRVPSCSPRSRYPNEHEFTVLFHAANHDFYPNHADSGYSYTRGVQGSSGAILLGCHC